MHFISVSMYLQESTNWEVDSDHQFLHGQPSHAKIYSSAGQTQNIHFSVPSRLWVLVHGPGIRTRILPPCSQVHYQLS